MLDRLCPKCRDPLSEHGVCGSCGFGRKGYAAPMIVDALRNRCAWYSNEHRCRYIGTMSPNIPTDKHYPELFCIGHFQCSDPIFGQRIVEESHSIVPADFDYSSQAIVARARMAYRNSPLPTPVPLTVEQRAEIEARWPQIALLEPTEDDLERTAIQAEG